MTQVEFFTDTDPNQIEHSVRGNVMSGREMRNASSEVEDFLASGDGADLFTESERLYADITLGLITERGNELTEQGTRAPMGPAFTDTYRHLRGMMQDEKANPTPDRDTIKQLADAHAAGEVAAAKLDALLAAVNQKRSLKTAVNYIQSPAFAEANPTEELGPDPFEGMSDEAKRRLAATLFNNLFGEK